jgi:hypothetical protein
MNRHQPDARNARWGILLIGLAAGSWACRASTPIGGEDTASGCPAASTALTYAAPCPSSCPTSASACGVDGARCEYGDDPRGPPCRWLALCAQGMWTKIPPVTASCEPLGAATDCPSSSSAAAGQACAVEHSWCPFEAEGTACLCTTCFWNGGVLPAPCPAGAPLWRCLSRPTGSDARCPGPLPTLGTSCSSDVLCHYQCGPDGLRKCQGGVWTGLDGGRCPL